MLSTIRLLKALPVGRKENGVNEELTKTTLQKGFIFAPEVIAAYKDTSHLIDLVNQAYGRSSEELNATFHKSFAKVRDASMQQLVFEQMIHYLTTYGAENAGVFSHDNVFIPGEQLDAPELQEGVGLVVIRGLTKEELKQELLKLLGSGVALHENTIKDVLDIAAFVGVQESDLVEIANKEVKAALYDYLNIVPSKPGEFLRYAIYRATNKTLLIKNIGTIEQIKASNNLAVSRLFDIYEEKYGLNRLAEIFYRYKPLFLAFRTHTKMKKTINKIRRLAKINHKPMRGDLLNDITGLLKQNKTFETKAFDKALSEANVFRKIRLAYALKFRTTDADSVLYRVRNGKSYATEFQFNNKTGAQGVFDTVMESIIEDVRPQVEGKKIFIPNGIKYGLPATEKQFTGNLPTGTHIEVLEDMVVGVHWENLPNYRVDLDLSIQNADGKVGWDSRYRDDKHGIYFSGDITDAPKPKGASELFHIGGTARGTWIMFVNYYNYNAEQEVPFKILVASESKENIQKNHTVDPNRILALSNTSINVKMKNLGIITADETSTKFYFAESNIGKAISAHGAAYTEQARKFLVSNYTNSIVLNDVLASAGAELVTEPTDADFDLSPESIDKTTILGLLRKDG